MSYKIFHNPRCGKSRTALKALQETGESIEVVEYLKETPSFNEIKDVLMRLDMKPMDIIRRKEAEFKPYKKLELTDDEWIKTLTEFPKLIERPIIIKGAKAVIARTPEAIEEILSN